MHSLKTILLTGILSYTLESMACEGGKFVSCPEYSGLGPYIVQHHQSTSSNLMRVDDFFDMSNYFSSKSNECFSNTAYGFSGSCDLFKGNIGVERGNFSAQTGVLDSATDADGKLGLEFRLDAEF